MRAVVLRRSFLGIFAALAPCALSGCATNSYMGISLSPPAATEEQGELQTLARRARIGDKHAQLELGIAFEQGVGVPRDLSKAETLFEKAASDSGGRLWVHVPASGKARARVIPLSTGVAVAGLPEAAERLRGMRLRP